MGSEISLFYKDKYVAYFLSHLKRAKEAVMTLEA